jgi:hypothetical protein
MNTQTEEIIWHKSLNGLKADTYYLVHFHWKVDGRSPIKVVGDAYYTGAYWILDRGSVENKNIVAWAELPKGWKNGMGDKS